MAPDKEQFRPRIGNVDVAQRSLVHLSKLSQRIHLRNSRQSSPQGAALSSLPMKIPPTSIFGSRRLFYRYASLIGRNHIFRSFVILYPDKLRFGIFHCFGHLASTATQQCHQADNYNKPCASHKHPPFAENIAAFSHLSSSNRRLF